MSTIGEAMDQLNTALERLQTGMSVAECHGAIAGLICARGEIEPDACQREIAPVAEEEAGDVLVAESRRLLTALCAENSRQLGDSVLDFHLILPEDSAPITERLHALGQWCQGFLLGLSLGGIESTERLPEDSADALQDMVEIAQVGESEHGEGEEDEQAYSELVEYVRTAVLLANEELHPTKAPPRDTTLH